LKILTIIIETVKILLGRVETLLPEKFLAILLLRNSRNVFKMY